MGCRTQAQMDNTWMQWRKLTFVGLKALQPAQQIKKILQVKKNFHYVKHMNRFPVFQKAFDITENTALSEIQYHYLFEGVSKDGQYVQNNSAKYDFDCFMNVFHVKTYHMQNYMTDIQHRTETILQHCENYYTAANNVNGKHFNQHHQAKY